MQQKLWQELPLAVWKIRHVIEEAKRELKTRLNGEKYTSLIPEEIDK